MFRCQPGLFSQSVLVLCNDIEICYVMKTLTEDYSGDVTTSFVQEKVKSGLGGLFGGKLNERKV